MGQGCCLSPTLFNLNIEDVLSEILRNKKGLSRGERKVNCARFADDKVILTSDTKALKTV